MRTKERTTIVRLSASQRAQLDRMAKRLNRPRVVLIREALNDLLSRYERREVRDGRV